MVVCYLGYEESAKGKAELTGQPVWPNGYLSMGNDLGISTSIDSSVGEDSTRGEVAQMLYNVKDTKPLDSTASTGIPITSGGGSSGGGGGGGGGCGGGG